jgi:hypothetical protein
MTSVFSRPTAAYLVRERLKAAPIGAFTATWEDIIATLGVINPSDLTKMAPASWRSTCADLDTAIVALWAERITGQITSETARLHSLVHAAIADSNWADTADLSAELAIIAAALTELPSVIDSQTVRETGKLTPDSVRRIRESITRELANLEPDQVPAPAPTPATPEPGSAPEDLIERDLIVMAGLGWTVAQTSSIAQR